MIRSLQEGPDRDYQRPNMSTVERPVSVLDDQHVESVPAVRSKRNVFVFGTFAFTVGALLILFNSPYRNEFLAPGPLSSVHANILKGQGSQRCAACHDAGDASLLAWTRDTVSGGQHLTQCQSDLCMECHDKTIPAEFARMPHGTAPEYLAKFTRKMNGQVKKAGFDAGMIFKPPTNDHGEIACSACHREHHGMQVNLSALTDRQCQTCHQNVFHSFETDHPEFTQWPQARRDRIAFDHVTHFGKHYPGKNTKFECAQCHVDDSFQNVKLLASYEQTCASCHNDTVVATSQEGLALFALPMVDTDAIAENQLTIGQWPENATGDFDGPLPPLMRLMLSADPTAADLLEKFGSDFDFSDVDPYDSEQVRDAVELVWHIKELLYDLSLDGPESIRQRVELAAGRTITPFELGRLTQGISHSVFQDATKRWLPDLQNEVPLRRQGREDRSVSWIPTRNDALFHLVNQDDEELAPNPLAGLLAGETETPDEPARAVVRNATSLPEPQPEMDLDAARKVVNRYLDNENNPDVLVSNPLARLLNQSGQASEGDAAVATSSPPTEASNPSVSSNASDGLHRSPEKVVQSNTLPPVSPSDPSGEPTAVQTPSVLAVTANSGWFRDDVNLSIMYRPVGHADEFLVAWTDLACSISQAESRHTTKMLFEQLTSPVHGVGLCSSCHTIDQQHDHSFVANWKTQYRNPSVREFTKFSHGPHLIQRECTDCHVLDVTTDKTQQFVGFDGALTKSNFFPITKNSCASCHAKGQADSSCTTCHNYHIGSKVTTSAN